MLYNFGNMYADIWYSQGGYKVSLIPSDKIMPNPDGFFSETYDEQDVAVHLGPYPDIYAALVYARREVNSD